MPTLFCGITRTLKPTKCSVGSALEGTLFSIPPMCGRYAMALRSDELQKKLEDFGLEIKTVKHDDRVICSLNVAPQSTSLVYCHDPSSGELGLVAMKWTLQPSFSKTPVEYSTFNTRSDSLSPLKPAFKCAATRRGIVFMQGYYEWQQQQQQNMHHSSGSHNKGERLPFYIYSSTLPLLFCLVIWDTNPAVGDIPTYSIVTTEAATNLKAIHERMPVIASLEAAKRWVDGPWPEVLDTLRPNPSLEHYRVAKTVNKVGINKADLNRPLKESKITDWFGKTKRKAYNNIERANPNKHKKPHSEGYPQDQPKENSD